MDELCYVHTMEYYSAIKKNKLLIQITDEFQNNYSKSKKLDQKKNMLNDAIYIKFQKIQTNQ